MRDYGCAPPTESLLDDQFLDVCSRAYGLHPFEVVSAINMADVEMMRPAIDQYRAWKAARLAVLKAQRDCIDGP